jgi:hypothetical protein
LEALNGFPFGACPFAAWLGSRVHASAALGHIAWANRATAI